jgi:hypothetical protein
VPKSKDIISTAYPIMHNGHRVIASPTRSQRTPSDVQGKFRQVTQQYARKRQSRR